MILRILLLTYLDYWIRLDNPNSNCALIRGDVEILATIGGGKLTSHLLIDEEEYQW